MSRTTETITFSLPPILVEKTEKLMKEQGKTKSEFLREALRKYIEDQEWKRIYKFGEMQAKKLGIRPEQVEDIIDEYRG